MKTDDLRAKFLDFFASKNHRIFPSDSLVPRDDPTVLFTAAGMNQFKPQLLGKITDLPRAASCQKCLRTDDLDKVGKTAGHHTFFEMLGNFSFGDYFKEKAISFAWEFVADILKISPDKLWVSVYEEDEEAYEIWLKRINIPRGKILRLGEKENFWPSQVVLKGPNGPCGPCSEIFFDQGQDIGCKRPECCPVCSCGRFVEVWNLVFTQFNRKEDKGGKGYLEPLPQKNIDTGMGLERLAAVMQGVVTNFEIDIFKPIVKEIEKITNNQEPITKAAIYAIADHIRAITFAIAEGVLPSNEERGYVVRKLIRKAAWHGRSLGRETKFLYKLVPIVARVMQSAYPELTKRRENIAQIVLAEEERFQNTLEEGLNILSNLITGLKEKKLRLINGEDAFKLYDTYGFPLELTELVAANEGFGVDKDGFMVKMNEQKKRSKDRSLMKGEIFLPAREEKLYLSEFKTDFIGYDSFDTFSSVKAILKDNSLVQMAKPDEFVGVILERTTFYAEGGGQVADTGKITTENLEIEVEDVQRRREAIVHFGKIIKGSLHLGERVRAAVDLERRLDIARNHTATHLLQFALREVLGPHVEQKGSYVGPDNLHFDFTHFKALSVEQLERIEELINLCIRRNDRLSFEITQLNQAKKMGALAFFGEKYEDEVRVVSIGNYSKELCGGTHLNFTGEIGVFLIVNENSIAQGIRRIEAITGRQAYNKIKQIQTIVKTIYNEYKIPPEKIFNYIRELSQRIKSQDKELMNFKLQYFKESAAQNLIDQADSFQGVKLIFKRSDEPVEILRKYMDILKEKIDKNGFIILASGTESRATVIIGLTPDLSGSFDAVASCRFVAHLLGGSGGGRPDFAQAGAKDVEKLKLLENKDNLFKIFKAGKR